MRTSSIIIILALVIIVMVVIVLILLRTARRIHLTDTPEGQKPEWMRSTPPPETMAATQAEGEGVTLYNYDQGEGLAAPFAEQIEDILRAKIKSDPYLSSYEVDFGTSADGMLDIRVGDQHYTSVDQVPDPHLQEAIKQAVASYNERNK